MLGALAGLAGCAELQSLRDRTDVQDMEIARLRQDKAEFEKAYYDTKAALEGEVAKAQRNAEDLQRQLEDARTLRSEHERDLTSRLNTRSLELEAQRKENADQKKIYDSQIAQLQRDVQSVGAERAAAVQRRAELDAELGEARTRVEDLTSQVGALKVGSQELAGRVEALQSDQAAREARVKTEREAREAAEKKNADLASQLAEAKTKLADLQKQVGAADATAAELKKLQDQNKSLEERVAKLQSAEGATLADDPSLQQAQSKLKAAVGDAPERKGVQVTVERDGLHVMLPSDLLFDRGSVILSESGQAVIAAVAPVVAGLARQRRVRIEGHTDNQPIADLPYADNWGLGFSRADRVRASLMESGVPGANLTALTRGQFSPLAANDTPERRAVNRRVEVVIGAAAGN
jgi:chemotaxis protein MotB